jgi:Flp pilus assembly protein TadG
VAAVEMSLIGAVFFGLLINGVEVGRYGLTLMQLNNAAQAAVSAAYSTCDAAHLPATENCPALATAVETALQSTTLGGDAGLESQLTEGWYCVTDTKTLQFVGAPLSKPANCSAVSTSSGSPALYLSVKARYDYKPLFPGTLTATFTSPLERTAMARFQ